MKNSCLGLCLLMLGLISPDSLNAQDPAKSPPQVPAQSAEKTDLTPSAQESDSTPPSTEPSAEPSQPADQTPSPDGQDQEQKSQPASPSDPKEKAKSEPQESVAPKQDDAPQDDAPQDDAPQDDAPQDDAPEDKDSPDQSDEDRRNSERSVRSLFGGLSQDPNREVSKRSKAMVALVKPLVVSSEASTVKVFSGSRMISLGTVVDRNGLILTKASELQGDVKCRFADGRVSPAVVIGVHPETDLALLKVELADLQPIHWGSGEIPLVGQWVASPIFDEVQVGIVGVNARSIPSSSPYLGIMPMLNNAEEIVGAKIDSVQPDTPADEADLMVGDIITKIDDVEIKNWDDLRRTLGQYDPKDEVMLTIQRGDQELKIKVMLGDREKLESRNSRVPQRDRSSMQNSMGSRPSQRRKDFPMAFQHDLGLNKTTCGGPVINLDGQVVGINIARAGRVDSLALPVNTILPVLESLKTGELAPAKVNRIRLSELEKELEDVNSKLKAIPDPNSLEQQLAVEKAREEELDRAKAELEKALAELENRIKVIDMKKGNLDKELKSMKANRNQLERKKLGLEREQKNLASGVR